MDPFNKTFDLSLFDHVQNTFSSDSVTETISNEKQVISVEEPVLHGCIRVKIRIVSKPPSNGIIRKQRIRRHIQEAIPNTIQPQSIQINNNICIYCKEESVVSDNDVGQRLCTKCGIEQGDILDEGQEWRTYNDDSTDNSRCGYSQHPLLSGNLSTVVRFSDRNSYFRLHQWNSMSSDDRTKIKVFEKMSAGSLAGGLPTCIVDKGAVLYSMMNNDSIRRGARLQQMVAAPVYYASKDRKYFRSSKEMSQIFGIKHKCMTNGQREFQKIMFQKNREFVREVGKAVTPEEFIRRYAVDLHLPDHILNQIIDASKIERNYHLSMHNKPESIAVALISIVCSIIGYKLDKKNLSKICKISKVTIAKAIKHLDQYRTILIPTIPTPSESC